MVDGQMHSFEIWREGYAVTGQADGPTCLGTGVGRTFKEACTDMAAKDAEFAKYFDADRMTYWGCKLYSSSPEV